MWYLIGYKISDYSFLILKTQIINLKLKVKRHYTSVMKIIGWL